MFEDGNGNIESTTMFSEMTCLQKFRMRFWIWLKNYASTNCKTLGDKMAFASGTEITQSFQEHTEEDCLCLDDYLGHEVAYICTESPNFHFENFINTCKERGLLTNIPNSNVAKAQGLLEGWY